MESINNSTTQSNVQQLQVVKGQSKFKKFLKYGIGIFIALFLISAIFGGGSSSSSTSKNANTVQDTPVKHGIYQYMDFSLAAYRSIGDWNTAPAGYKYVVATIHVKNTGDDTYYSNSLYWQLKANGLTYNTDMATFDKSVKYHLVNIGPGGEDTFEEVFLVPEDVNTFELIYNGF
jgi:hypothetical protein